MQTQRADSPVPRSYAPLTRKFSEKTAVKKEGRPLLNLEGTPQKPTISGINLSLQKVKRFRRRLQLPPLLIMLLWLRKQAKQTKEQDYAAKRG